MSIGHPHFNKDVGMDSYLNGVQNSLANMYVQQASLHQANAQMQAMHAVASAPKLPEKKTMFKEITTDIKSFLLEHRGVIYFIVFALTIDHFFFRGAFKARLQGMADKVVTKVEEKIK